MYIQFFFDTTVARIKRKVAKIDRLEAELFDLRQKALRERQEAIIAAQADERAILELL